MIPLSAWTTFIDPLAIGIVLGGTAVATLLRGPLPDARAALLALRRLRGSDPDLATVRAAIARAERVAMTRGLLRVETDEVPDAETAEALRRIVDGAGPEAIGRYFEEEAAARARRHAVVHQLWSAAAEAAPAMGMIGTLIGLVRMFSRMDDPSAIGGAMAIALLTTLYGALLANLVAAPIAARLQRTSAQEREARRLLHVPLIEVAHRFAPASAPPRPKVAA